MWRRGDLYYRSLTLPNEPCKNSSLKCLCGWLVNAKRALLQPYKPLVASKMESDQFTVITQAYALLLLDGGKRIKKLPYPPSPMTTSFQVLKLIWTVFLWFFLSKMKYSKFICRQFITFFFFFFA